VTCSRRAGPSPTGRWRRPRGCGTSPGTPTSPARRSDAAGFSQPPTTFIRDAHAAGLDVVAYTFRAENSFLPTELRSDGPTLNKPGDYGNAFAEFQQFFDLGVDGVFTDNPDLAKAARDDE
jgi:glycerophosphoryl diester phosphodiesterase